MIAAGLVERVPANLPHAQLLLEQARTHLGSAEELAERDANAAFAVQYDAARKALAAVLLMRGFRVKSKGGHAGLYQAVRVDLPTGDRAVIRAFDELRKRRHEVEYLTEAVPQATPEEVLVAIGQSRAIVEWAIRQLPGPQA